MPDPGDYDPTLPPLELGYAQPEPMVWPPSHWAEPLPESELPVLVPPGTVPVLSPEMQAIGGDPTVSAEVEPGDALSWEAMANAQPEIEMPPEVVAAPAPHDAASAAALAGTSIVAGGPPGVPSITGFGDSVGQGITGEGLGQETPTDIEIKNDEGEIEMPAEPEEAALEMAARLDADPDYELVKEKQRLELANRMAAQQLEASRKDLERQEANHRNYVDAQAKAKAETDKIAADAAQISESNELASMPGWKLVIAGIMAGLGGWMQGKNGGRNIGLESVQRGIERAVADKRAQLQARQKAADGQLQNATDLYRAEETYRIAAYDTAIRQIETEALNYNPKGTIAMGLVDKARALSAARGAALEKSNRDRVDMYAKLADINAKQVHTAVEEGDFRRRVAEDKRKALARAAGPARVTPQQAELFKFLTNGKELPVGATHKDLSFAISMAGKVNALGAEDRKKTAEEKKLELERGIAGLTMKDGSVFLARGSQEGVELLNRKVTGARTLARFLDEARRIRTGWTSDTNKSKEWQQLQANWAAAKGVAKDVLGLGALSGPDMDLVDKFIGTDDPTQFRDPTDGIKKARENIINMVGDELTTRGYDGKFDIPDITGFAIPTNTGTDEDFKDAHHSPSLEDVRRAAGRGGQRLPDEPSPDVLISEFTEGDDPELENAVLPQTRRTIEALATIVRFGEDDATKDEAVAKLSDLIEGGGNAGIRRAARDALLSATQEVSSEGIGPDTETARISVPKAKPKAKGKGR